jgi:di/tricarboxylate transporter
LTLDIALVLAILLVALFLFITERVRIDLVALMVLCALVATGLVDAPDAVAGFSNGAVIAIWAMFILSDGLTRTGIANIIGRSVLRVAGRSEIRMIAVIMLTSGALSFFMNNIAVAALMLPVVVDVARRTRLPGSRLLMPLAFGSLLGGLTTLFGTSTNLLISGGLQDAGLPGFSLLDFLPMGTSVLLIGTAFVALVGRHALPRKKPEDDAQRLSQRKLRSQYGLQARSFEMRIPEGSVLIGKTLAESRVGGAGGLIVMAIERRGRVEFMPSRQTVLRGGDKLLVQGRLDRFHEFQRWSELVIEREAPVLQDLMEGQVKLIEATVAEGSPLVSEILQQSEFRKAYRANVLAIRRGESVRRVKLSQVPLRVGDVVLLQAAPETVETLQRSAAFSACHEVGETELTDVYGLQERIFVVRVPRESSQDGDALSHARLGDAFDFRVLALFREGELKIMPDTDQPLKGGDLLLIQGREQDLDVLRGLQQLEIERGRQTHLSALESERLSLVEATLDPRSTLVDQPVAEINFREKYGLELVGVWRKGQALRSDLEHLSLQLGDALLLLGPREKLKLLERDSDFLLLTPVSQRAVDSRKAPLGAAIMLGIVAAVMSGWLPIYIAAMIGATLMVLTRCMSMEEAYRAIEWRAIFLIAGMMPLGTALQDTGAAGLLADYAMAWLAPLGPWWVIGGLYMITAAGTVFIPSTAFVVLMNPIVLSVSAELAIDPRTAMMAVAMAAASLLSPISHPANMLVMGPGGYRFADYFRLGLPLTLVVFVTVMLLLPIFWPLQAVVP